MLRADPAWDGKEVSLVFDGAMADAVVYLNGEQLGAHKDGYTPFEARLTGKLAVGDNLLAVKIDGSENPEIPPFGGRIDYLTYAGIYRDVWLKVTPPVSIGSVKIETPDVLAAQEIRRASASISPTRRTCRSAGTLTATLRDPHGKTIATASAPAAARVELRDGRARGHRALGPRQPHPLHASSSPSATTPSPTRFGFRAAEFTPEGFRLNGRPLKLRGLNRHQSFPYAGYALGRAAQERDAEILKHELHLNIVRTSHYPQSTWFLDACDRLGLLVFEEIPGWQHIGGDAWKAEAVENVRRMITRDWNHPSIVIWGVRINESQDNHDFYAETNRVAHELDPTRQTGGVRFITDSELLEDVYTMNDFILGNEELGGNRPRTALRPQRETTGLDKPVPYMITEFDGHMYPTKSFDQEQRQAEHVIRHLEVLNAAYGDPDISGAIGWCAFDYNTHKDFGSGDRICHHGVMDMFREPKFAAYAYASQCEPDEEVDPRAGDLLGARRAQHRRRAAADRADQLRRGRAPLRRQSAEARRPGPRALSPSAARAGHLRPAPFHRRRTRPLGHAVGGRRRSSASIGGKPVERGPLRRRSGRHHARGRRRPRHASRRSRRTASA